MGFLLVENPVHVSFLGVELNGKTTRVTGGVGRALLTTNGREANNSLGLLADLVEHVHAGEVSDVVGDLELAIGTGTLGMDNSLGDSLACSGRLATLLKLRN